MDYYFIGWCKQDNHDKVWGIIELEKNPPARQLTWAHEFKVCIFWGRRGKKLQTKVLSINDHTKTKMAREKVNRGYQEIDTSKLAEVYPGFEQDLEKTAIWALLRG